MQPPRLRALIALSIAAALVTIGLKSTAYVVTGSIGLLSDALESVVNLLAAVTAYVSLRYSARPVDANHTYGHEKIEYFSSGLEGVLILVAGAGIIYTAVPRIWHPAPLDDLGVGTLIAVAASAINFVVARLLINAGRKHRSIVLEADGRHLMSDVYTSAGVVIGIGLVIFTGWQVLDPVIAIAVALNIAWTGIELIRRSFNGLMDHAIPPEELEMFRASVRAHLPPSMQFHALRTRQAGARRFADFHLLVPGKMSVQEAHDVAERVEASLQELFPHLQATIHIEPIEAAASWADNELAEFEGKEPSV